MRKSDRYNKRWSRRGGFTLVEVMIVLFILMTMASVGVLAFNQMLTNANINIARTHVDGMKTPLNAFKLNIGRYPSNDEGIQALLTCPNTLSNPAKWSGPYISDDAIKEDPWGNAYMYESDGARYRFWSLGPDMANGTEDDIIAVNSN